MCSGSWKYLLALVISAIAGKDLPRRRTGQLVKLAVSKMTALEVMDIDGPGKITMSLLSLTDELTSFKPAPSITITAQDNSTSLSEADARARCILARRGVSLERSLSLDLASSLVRTGGLEFGHADTGLI